MSGQVELSDLLDRYVIDQDLVERLTEEPRLLDDLARACEVTYHLPWQARRAVQSLTDLGPLATALDALIGRRAHARTASLDDVCVVVDAPGPEVPPRVCLVNAAEMHRAPVELEDARFSMAEFAAGVPDAAAYVTTPFTLQPGARHVTVRQGEDDRTVAIRARTRLAAGSGADSEWIEPALFRGRHDQLNQILGIMHPASAVRVPVAV